jgi:hypothetical protein
MKATPMEDPGRGKLPIEALLARAAHGSADIEWITAVILI